MIADIKFFFLFILSVITTGCSSVQIPQYIPDEAPYKKTFYAPYDNVMSATKKALDRLGWTISQVTNPAIYEANKDFENFSKQALIFTEIKQYSRIFFTKYVKINVYLISQNEGTDIEVRYMKINSYPFKSFKSYKNASLAKKLFQRISRDLEK